MATVEVFRSMALDMATVRPPAGLELSQISAALGAFDSDHAADTETTTVTSLSDRRQRRVGIPAWLGAAAAAALVVGGIGFAATRSGSNDDATDTAAPSLSASATNSAAEDDAMDDDAELSTEMVEEEMVEEEMAADGAEGGSDVQADGDDSTAFDDPAAEESGQAPADREAEAAAAAAFYEENGPFALAELDADTAAGFLEQLTGAPLLPIEESPCSASPVVADLPGVDSFIPVVFKDELSSLIVQSGVPDTARIIGPTCEVELS